MKTTTTAHVYLEDPELPGTCVCGRPDPLRVNVVHQMPDLDEQVRESRRRIGEADED